MTLAAGPALPRPLFEDEHQTYRESFSRFLAEEVAPAYPEWERRGRLPASLYAAAAQHGFVAMQVAEDHGGAGVADIRFNVVLLEEAMRLGLPAVALGLGALNDVAVPVLLAGASAEQVERWSPELAAGAVTVALAGADEPVTARSRGHGWVLDGVASFVIGGLGAGLLVIAAGGGGDGGDVELFLIEGDAPGLERGASEELVGLRACDLAEIRCDALEVGPESRLGLDGSGRGLLSGALVGRDLSIAVTALAGARAALSWTLEYVHERRAFGQPIASFENTRHVLAELASRVEAVEALIDACVRRRSEDRLTVGSSSSARLRSVALYGDAVDCGVQLHGGYGYMVEYPIARAYADARFFRLLGGGSAKAKDLIASSIGLPG